jgi:hypothetical protein
MLQYLLIREEGGGEAEALAGDLVDEGDVGDAVCGDELDSVSDRGGVHHLGANETGLAGGRGPEGQARAGGSHARGGEGLRTHEAGKDHRRSLEHASTNEKSDGITVRILKLL